MRASVKTSTVAGSRQRGVVLLITLIMLGIFSIIVISMVSGSNTNFKIAGNQQFRMEAKLAARQAVEAYISNPANFAPPLPTVNSSFDVDFDGDGVDDMTAVVEPPECLRAVAIKNTELDILDAEDKQCVKSLKPNNPGQISDSGSNTSGNSYCEKITWDVKASVADVTTGADIVLHQGVFVRAIAGTNCF